LCGAKREEVTGKWRKLRNEELNPLNSELNPICHLLALLGGHHMLYVSRIRVNELYCSPNIVRVIK
jgi:transposase